MEEVLQASGLVVRKLSDYGHMENAQERVVGQDLQGLLSTLKTWVNSWRLHPENWPDLCNRKRMCQEPLSDASWEQNFNFSTSKFKFCMPSQTPANKFERLKFCQTSVSKGKVEVLFSWCIWQVLDTSVSYYKGRVNFRGEASMSLPKFLMLTAVLADLGRPLFPVHSPCVHNRLISSQQARLLGGLLPWNQFWIFAD